MNKNDVKKMKYNRIQEDMLEVVRSKTGVKDLDFSRLVTAFYLVKAASQLHLQVDTPANGIVPCNMYAFGFAASGQNKGYSSFIIEKLLLKKFYNKLQKLQGHIEDKNIVQLSYKIKSKNLEELVEEFASLGPYIDWFDSATLAAIKQYRQRIMMSGYGSMTMIVDEIGYFLAENDIFKLFLILWDIGVSGEKLLKVTSDQKRSTPLDKMTPTNLLCFGTGSKLFDGGSTEKIFMDFLKSGYARRSFFAHSATTTYDTNLSAQDRWLDAINNSNAKTIKKIQAKLSVVANKKKVKPIKMPRDTGIKLYEYRIYCEERINKLHESEEELSAYLLHAHMRVAKLAAVYTFFDGSSVMTPKHLEAAIKLSEDSYVTLKNYILARPEPHVRLIKYISNANTPVTHADLAKLPYYPKTKQAQEQQLMLAEAWGYTHGVTLTRKLKSNIEFLDATAMDKFNPDKLILAHSQHITEDYQNVEFNEKTLLEFLNTVGVNYVNHHLKGGYRNEKNCKPGSNIIILDIDEPLFMDTVKLVLEDYKFIAYETKRSTKKKPRVRILLFLNYVPNLKKSEYAKFCTNIYNWVPFDVDRQTNQRSRKWLTSNKNITVNEGKLLNIFKFLPETKENELLKVISKNIGSLPQFESWILKEWKEGNRNNLLFRYKRVLKERGYNKKRVAQLITHLNNSSNSPLLDNELQHTVLLTK